MMRPRQEKKWFLIIIIYILYIFPKNCRLGLPFYLLVSRETEKRNALSNYIYCVSELKICVVSRETTDF